LLSVLILYILIDIFTYNLPLRKLPDFGRPPFLPVGFIPFDLIRRRGTINFSPEDRWLSSGFLHHVVWWKFTDVSGVRAGD
jgi:hypothetical protein